MPIKRHSRGQLVQLHSFSRMAGRSVSFARDNYPRASAARCGQSAADAASAESYTPIVTCNSGDRKNAMCRWKRPHVQDVPYRMERASEQKGPMPFVAVCHCNY